MTIRPKDRHLPAKQHAMAIRMRADGMGWGAISLRLGLGYETIRRALDPEYNERRKTTIRERNRKRRPDSKRVRENPRRVDVPTEVETARAARGNALRSLTSVIMGDPPPGYSALDQKRREHVS